jgi:hypothetical protein
MKENFLISLGKSSEKFEISDKGQAPSEEKNQKQNFDDLSLKASCSIVQIIDSY